MDHKSTLERTVCSHAHERNSFLAMTLWVFIHRARHFQCLFSFSGQEETNRSLSKWKNYWKTRKHLFKKRLSFRKLAWRKCFSSSEPSESEWFSSIWKCCIKEKNIIFHCSSTMPFLTPLQSLRNSQHQQGESSVLHTALFGKLQTTTISWDSAPVCTFIPTGHPS